MPDPTQAALTFPSDRPLRARYFTEASYSHPAKMHARLLMWLVEAYTAPGDVVLDPMCGIGTTLLAALSQRDVVGYEIEPRFLAEAHRNAARIIDAAGLFAGRVTISEQDAREPWTHQADAVLFSPPYGCEATRNRFRVQGILSHKQRLLAARPDRLGRRWRLLLEREQTQPGSAGSIQFHYGDSAAQLGHLRGARYWSEMERIYMQARAALRPGGKMILVIKDHIRRGQRVRVADETADRCASLGFRLVARHARRVWPLSLWQRRRKERGEPIVEEEDILVLEKINA